MFKTMNDELWSINYGQWAIKQIVITRNEVILLSEFIAVSVNGIAN